MKDRPILFSAPMVRALLEGRKTQTRRIAKPETVTPIPPGLIGEVVLPCPYGQPGDRLWVRETYLCTALGRVDYRADGDLPESVASMLGGWRPSIFMFRRFSRILLEITDIRVERLQDISEADAKAEGVLITNEWTGCADDLDGSYVKAYRHLWEKINGPGSWDENPWVWVIVFKRIES